MTPNTKARLLGFITVVALASCNAETNKIGSTVKGDRIAVIEPARALEAGKDIQSRAPLLSRETLNLSWPQTGYDSDHAIPNAQASVQPKIIWKKNIGNGSSSDFKLLAHPVAGRGKIYTMDAQGLVRAYNMKSGERLWERDTTPKDSDDDAIGGGLALDGDTVFAATGFGDVYALKAGTGEVKWRKSLLKPLRAAPTSADARVYVVSVDNELTSLDAASGDILWHHSGITENAALMGASNPAVQGDSVFVAYNSGEIFGLRVQNGRVSWSYSLSSAAQGGALPAIADIRGLPVLDHGRLFAISHSGRFAAIDQRTGDRLWEADIGGIDTPVVSGDAVFVYGGDSQLIALSQDNGRALWVKDLPKYADLKDKDSDPLVWSGPVLAGEKLWMVNSRGILASFSPQNGAAEAKIDLGDPVYVSPIVVDRTFYVVTDDGTLIALR